MLLTGAGYWLIPTILDPSLPAFPVLRSELIQTVVASGHAESHSRIDIGSQITSGHRALALEPPLILADEPTGNLDTKSADAVFELMRKVNTDTGATFLMVTHNLGMAQRCDRIIELVDGRVVSAKAS